MRAVHTALSRVPGIQQVTFQDPDRFVVTYDATRTGVMDAARKAITTLGYGVKS